MAGQGQAYVGAAGLRWHEDIDEFSRAFDFGFFRVSTVSVCGSMWRRQFIRGFTKHINILEFEAIHESLYCMHYHISKSSFKCLKMERSIGRGHTHWWILARNAYKAEYFPTDCEHH